MKFFILGVVLGIFLLVIMPIISNLIEVWDNKVDKFFKMYK